jgi:hypothetical protein
MNEILSKLSSYNLFNYLLPGVLFVVLSSKLTHFSFIQQDIVTGAFLYYFIGLVISRFGSLVVEPLLKWVSFLQFVDYRDFTVASQKDAKLELLSEINNTYRTLCSLFILLLLLRLYEKLEGRFAILKEWSLIVLAALLLITFLLSYRKQTNYITRRTKILNG